MGLIALKPQDVVILLKIVVLGNKEWMNNQLANELGISPAEISCSLERCKIAKLIDNTKKRVNILSFQDFMIHGLKYVYPPLPGAIVRGMPTAFSAEPIRSKISQGQDSYVWPSKDGNHRGQAIEPLYRTVPEACSKDNALYELLVIADTLRMGRVRELEIAIEELKIRLDHYAQQ